jgi:hypothetical protein
MEELTPLTDLTPEFPPKGKKRPERLKHANPANVPTIGTGSTNESLTDDDIAEAFSKAGGQPKRVKGRLSSDVGAYKPEYCQSLIDFFDRPPTREILETWYHSDGSVKRESLKEIPNSPPHLGQWAMSIGFYPFVAYEWARKHKDFAYALACARSLRKHLVIDNALKGLYNPIFAKLAAANWFQWSEKQDVHHSGEVKSVLVAYHKPEREAPVQIEAAEVLPLPGPAPTPLPLPEAEGEG